MDINVKQSNDKFLFQKQQELELAEYEFKNSVERIQQALELGKNLNGHYFRRDKNDIEVLLDAHIPDNCDCLASVYKHSDNNFYTYGKKYYVDILAQNDLKYIFPIGKYKDRYVLDIFEQDKDYCRWFSINVISENPNIIKICDVLHKWLNDVPYYVKLDKVKAISNIFDLIPLEWHPYINTERLMSGKVEIRDVSDFYDEPFDEYLEDAYSGCLPNQ